MDRGVALAAQQLKRSAVRHHAEVPAAKREECRAAQSYRHGRCDQIKFEFEPPAEMNDDIVPGFLMQALLARFEEFL